MKIILMGDQHLTKFWKSNNATSNRARKLIEYLRINLEDIIQEFDSKEKLQLIIAGDFYDTIHTNMEMLIYIKEKIFPLLDRFDSVIAIAGNHETFIDKSGIQKSLIDIALPEKVYKIINKMNHIAYKDSKINFIFIPHVHNLKDVIDSELHLHLLDDYINIIVAHFTPKEIFSFEKYSINELIDKYSNNFKIPYIILGHYHKPVIHKHNNTIVISIGNSYYQTIDDVRESLDRNVKRYLILDDSNLSIISRYYILPDIQSYIVDNQKEFDEVIVNDIHSKYPNDQDIIIYLKSSNLIDYSVLVFEGYDVYFDMIEDSNSILASIPEITDKDNTMSNSLTLHDRWNRYLELLPNVTFNDQDKKLIDWFFSKRNDSDITLNNIISQISNKVESNDE